MTSIRLFIGRGSEDRDSLIERVTKILRHFQIEPEAGNDRALFLQLTISAHADPVGAERDDMQASKEPAADMPVYDQLTALGQVDKHNFDVSHFNQPFQNSPAISYQQVPRPLGKVSA